MADLTSAKFIAAVATPALASERETGVPASVTIAQAILESDWGRSLLSVQGQNYFGIKAFSEPGPAGVISMNTWEVLSGKDVTVKDAFKAYHNLDESVMDHGRFLRINGRYAPAFKFTRDPREFARQIAAAGYATDPAYPSKLIALMDRYDLYRFGLGQ
jgi:flagellum-specific peptidoglycan hydrolase FlgJ